MLKGLGEYVTRVIEYTVSGLRLGLLSKICACLASMGVIKLKLIYKLMRRNEINQ